MAIHLTALLTLAVIGAIGMLHPSAKEKSHGRCSRYAGRSGRAGIVNNQIPLSIGGGIGQSRTLMLLLRKAHLGEVSVTVWPNVLKEMCAEKNIFVLE